MQHTPPWYQAAISSAELCKTRQPTEEKVVLTSEIYHLCLGRVPSSHSLDIFNK